MPLYAHTTGWKTLNLVLNDAENKTCYIYWRQKMKLYHLTTAAKNV